VTERFGAEEHPVHVGHGGHVPSPDVAIEQFGVLEHRSRVGDGGHVPSSDVLVEQFGVAEHAVHVDHGGHVPPPDVPVELFCAVEHPVHVGHGGHVPTRDVAGEVDVVVEQVIHARDPTHVPRAHRGTRSALRIGRVDVVAVGHRGPQLGVIVGRPNRRRAPRDEPRDARAEKPTSGGARGDHVMRGRGGTREETRKKVPRAEWSHVGSTRQPPRADRT